jgi:hypothetical protein
MRTRSPCWKVVTVWTGVPKSVTSIFRRRPSGSVDFRNSTTSCWPCWRMSTPTWLLARSTTMRPEPSGPRRKSRSLSGCVSRLRLSAKAGTGAALDGRGGLRHRLQRHVQALAVDLRAVVRWAIFRFSTRRARSAACTTLTERRFPTFTIERDCGPSRWSHRGSRARCAPAPGWRSPWAPRSAPRPKSIREPLPRRPAGSRKCSPTAGAAWTAADHSAAEHRSRR